MWISAHLDCLVAIYLFFAFYFDYYGTKKVYIIAARNTFLGWDANK